MTTNFKIFCWLYLLLCTFSCSGYRFADTKNPFALYEINEVYVPMFVTQATLPDVAGVLTKDLIHLLGQYPDLRVIAGDVPPSGGQSVLLGIVTSDQYLNISVNSQSQTFTSDNGLRESIGDRPIFYVPASNTYRFNVQLVLIKNPRPAEIKLLRSNIGSKIPVDSKVVINEVLTVSGSFSRHNEATTSPDAGGVVNFTKNAALFEKSVGDMSQQVMQNFKREVLDAF